MGSSPIPATNGPLVKRLRHRPFTAVTGVRFSHGSPKKVYTIWCIPFLLILQGNRTCRRHSSRMFDVFACKTTVFSRRVKLRVERSETYSPTGIHLKVYTFLGLPYTKLNVPRVTFITLGNIITFCQTRQPSF